MKKSIRITLALILLLTAACAGCSTPATATPQPSASVVPSASAVASATPTDSPSPTVQPSATQEAKKFLIKLQLDSKAIAQNLNGENTKRDLYVLLPPAYYDSEKRYPVVYYVNGFSMLPGGFAASAKDDMAKVMGGKEFILVEIDANNKFGGSFLVNSPVTGNWEDYAVNEVVPLIDGKFRTIALTEARGIAGFSMGGFAALNLAMRHPDVFCATYALCPGLLEDKGLAEALTTWQGDVSFLRAYGQAFCPLIEKTDTYWAIPALDGSTADAAIVKKWESGFGNLQQKIDDYLAKGMPLKAIAIEYGENDSYSWIPKGCVYFSTLLDAKGIKHTLKPFSGGHTVSSRFGSESLVPFFSGVFTN